MDNVMDRISRFQNQIPVNVEQAITDLGISLRKGATLADGIAGHIKRIGGDRFEIATTLADHYFRQRFTMAHELGHYVLHRSLIGEGVNDNTKYRTAAGSELYNRAIDDVHERQANAFAASLLIPERLLKQYIGANTQAPLKGVATAFQVSPSAMRWRLKSLDLYRGRFEGQ